jgi:hypothetical protein
MTTDSRTKPIFHPPDAESVSQLGQCPKIRYDIGFAAGIQNSGCAGCNGFWWLIDE